MSETGSTDEDLRLDGFRRWSISATFILILFGTSLGAALAYAGFAGSSNDLVGVVGVAVVIGVLLFAPRVWRGGWIQFNTDCLEVHSPWSATRLIPYSDVDDVTVFAGITARYRVRVQYMPAIVRHSRRRVLLNDFRGWASAPDQEEVPHQVSVAVDRIREAVEHHR